MVPIAPSKAPAPPTELPVRLSYRIEFRPGRTLDLFIVFSGLLIAVTGWLIFRYLGTGNSLGTAWLILADIIILLNILLYRRNSRSAVIGLQVMLLVMTIGSFLSGGIEGNGWFWILPYPFATFFLNGYARGKDWNLLLVLFVVITTLGEALGLWSLPYQSETTLLYAVLFMFMLAVAFISNFQTSRQLKTILSDATHERQLEQEYEKFKLAVDHTSEQILITDPEGMVLYANPATEATTGFSIDEIIGHKAGSSKLWGGRMSREFYRQLWKTVKQAKRPFLGDVVNRRKDGRLYDSQLHINPILDKHRNIRFLVGTERDISMEKTAEKLLARDEATLLGIGDGLVAVDQDGKITIVNPAFERLLGWTSREVVGRKFTDMVPMQDSASRIVSPPDRLITKILNGTISKSTTITTRQHYQRKDGSWIPVVLTVSPMLVNEQVTGAVVVFRDITREEAMEKTKSEFVSVASHQLQTPLSAIGWLTELLLGNVVGRLTVHQKDMIKKIDQSNQRMVQVVNALLNTSRAELGTFIIAPEPTDLTDLAREMVTQAKINPPHRVTLLEEYSPNCPRIPTDPLLMRMIMQNLISNALRYTPDDGQVTVRLSHDRQGVTFEVADTGMGIPPGSKDLIFTKFYRAPNASQMVPGGIGLGLYLIKTVIDSSGGTITFTSVENKGATFQVRYPLTGMQSKAGTRRLSDSDGHQSVVA